MLGGSGGDPRGSAGDGGGRSHVPEREGGRGSRRGRRVAVAASSRRRIWSWTGRVCGVLAAGGRGKLVEESECSGGRDWVWVWTVVRGGGWAWWDA